MIEIHCGDALPVLRTLPDNSVDTCVTSPPYWGLRDYGTAPLIWDGAPDCEHSWGSWSEQHDVREETITGKTRTTDRSYGGDESRRFDGNHQKHAHGQFCEHCGAWRGSFGLEPTPALYIKHATAIFREVRRVVRHTCWINIGDSYNAHPGQRKTEDKAGPKQVTNRGAAEVGSRNCHNLKPKDLIGIPWMLAFALRDDGWWLRQEIIWHKPNPMPESVNDRPTRSHEQVFLFAKSAKYYYNADAIKEPSVTNDIRRPYGSQGAWDLDGRPNEQRHGGEPRSWKGSKFDGERDVTVHPNVGRAPRVSAQKGSFNGKTEAMADTGQNAFRAVTEFRNKRSVWTIPSQPTPEAHFATFPIALAEPCILAGCPEGGTVLDPFCGAGTTGLAALKNGRQFVGIELSAPYVEIVRNRLMGKMPLLAQEFIRKEVSQEED